MFVDEENNNNYVSHNNVLFFSDPSQFPDLKDGELPDISAPSFTQTTLDAKTFFMKQSGDSWKVACEATGNPRPEIFWYKDGLPFDADGIRYRANRSTVRLRNLMKVDSAVYTCMARNIIGATSKNFTLNVEVPLSEQPTVVGNGNVSVLVGDTASLQCRVNSGAPPHIKWLKKENPGAPADMYTITVGEDRYRVIHTGEDIPVGVGEYLNKLVIANAQESDSGLYICFVTNSGGSFNYKPSYLRVYPAGGIGGAGGNLPPIGDRTTIGGNPTAAGGGESTHILALVLCLGIMVLLILIFIIVCVVRKSSKAASLSDSSPDVVRSLMPASRSTESNATITTVTSHKFDAPLPPPPSMLWNSHHHPPPTNSSTMKKSNLYMTASGDFASLHENSSTNLLADRESPVSAGSGGAGSCGNQYEVPYCYSVRTLDTPHNTTKHQQHQQLNNSLSAGSFTTNNNSSSHNNSFVGHNSSFSGGHNSSFTGHNNSMTGHNNSLTGHNSSAATGMSDRYPFRQYPYFQYLSDYEPY